MVSETRCVVFQSRCEMSRQAAPCDSHGTATHCHVRKLVWSCPPHAPGGFLPHVMKLPGGRFGLCPLRSQTMNQFSCYTHAIGTGVWQDFKLFNPLLDIMEQLLLFSLWVCKWPNTAEHRPRDLTQVRYLSSFPSAEVRLTDTFIFAPRGMEPILTLDLVWFGPMRLTGHPTASAKHKVWSVSTMPAPLGQLQEEGLWASGLFLLFLSCFSSQEGLTTTDPLNAHFSRVWWAIYTIKHSLWILFWLW